jgi:hypothetical protein
MPTCSCGRRGPIIAWQLGHLIASGGNRFLPNIRGFGGGIARRLRREAHQERPPPTSQETSSRRRSISEAFEKVRGAMLAAVEKMSDADFDRPNNGPMKDFAPTMGTLLLLAVTTR